LIYKDNNRVKIKEMVLVICECGKGYAKDNVTGEIGKAGMIHLSSKFHLNFMKKKAITESKLETLSSSEFVTGKIYKLCSDEGDDILIEKSENIDFYCDTSGAESI
jgi:hypothetical protein